MNRIPRRVFTAEYKAEAIKLAGAVGMPTAARQLDIATNLLYLWIKQSTEGKLKASGPSKLSAEQQRIRELDRELAIARTERDLLKKAAAFVALDSICFYPLEVLARADCHCRQSHQHYQRQKPQWQQRLIE